MCLFRSLSLALGHKGDNPALNDLPESGVPGFSFAAHKAKSYANDRRMVKETRLAAQ